MRKLVALVITAVLLAAAIAVNMIAAGSFFGGIGDCSVMNYDASSGEKPMTVSEVEALVERIDTIVSAQHSLSYCAELKETALKGEKITPVVTNELFFDNYGIEVNGFGETGAVISRQLALRLFFSYDVIGEKLEINGREYTIAGLYDRHEGSMLRLMSDDRERVYIGSAENAGKAAVTEMCFENNTPSAATLEQMDLKSYRLTDFAEKRLVIGGMLRTGFLLLYVIALITAVRLYLRYCSSYFKRIRAGMKSDYARGCIGKNGKRTAVFILVTIALPAAFVLILFFADLSIYIVPGYIPYDNLFDIPHYLDAHAAAVRSLNSSALLGNLFILRLYSFTFRLMAVNNIIILALGSILSVKSVKLFRKGRSK